MKCIDCEHLIKWGKTEKKEEFYQKCDYAKDIVKECIYFKNAHRKIIHLENVDYEKMVKEMLED